MLQPTFAGAPFDYVVAIGRFSPIHNGHVAMLTAGFERAAKMILLIGSAQEPRMPKNPWNAAERAVMIRHSLPQFTDRLIIDSVLNHRSDNAWVAEVQEKVSRAIAQDGGDPATARVCIVGRDKDASSYYLKSFPTWPTINVERTPVMGATAMRAHYFNNTPGDDMILQGNVPAPVHSALMAFRNGPDYADLVACQKVLLDYPGKYGAGPHLTADAIVFWRGHVLLIERKSHPGKGQLAFPGGFMDVTRRERLVDTMLRELTEETRLKVAKGKILGNLRMKETYDDPDRDPRARIITTAYGINLDEFEEAPAVKARSDAKRADWIPIGEALKMRERFFADHFTILEEFVTAREMASIPR
jgi:bifunctional NMN adenylyltransferase/nudix hydrolase